MRKNSLEPIVCSAGATTILEVKHLNTEDMFTQTQVVLSGRASGVVTGRVKAYGADDFQNSPAISIDLATKQSQIIDGCLSEVELTVPAGDDVTALLISS